jgi:hypothetical protein
MQRLVELELGNCESLHGGVSAAGGQALQVAEVRPDPWGIAGTATSPTGSMGDCIARRDLPARMVSLMEGDCRERGFVKESGAHARMEGAPRCDIAEGERRDVGLRRRAGGRARAGACRGEETAARRGGEGRSRQGGDLAGLREMEGGGCGRREGTRGRRNRDGGGGCGREEGITGGGIRTEEGNRAMAEQGVVHAYTKHIIVVEIYPSIR